MFPGIDPKKMQGMMKQLGIAQEEISATRVIIETDDYNIVINNPSVVKVKMQGQETFQIMGEVSQESASNTTEQDIQTLIEKTGCTKDAAINALKKADGDLTEALLELS